jgi:hypothetical protein
VPRKGVYDNEDHGRDVERLLSVLPGASTTQRGRSSVDRSARGARTALRGFTAKSRTLRGAKDGPYISTWQGRGRVIIIQATGRRPINTGSVSRSFP